jgi:hypothetical protein
MPSSRASLPAPVIASQRVGARRRPMTKQRDHDGEFGRRVGKANGSRERAHPMACPSYLFKSKMVGTAQGRLCPPYALSFGARPCVSPESITTIRGYGIRACASGRNRRPMAHPGMTKGDELMISPVPAGTTHNSADRPRACPSWFATDARRVPASAGRSRLLRFRRQAND